MTIWIPDLAAFTGPRYLAIAAALAADVEDGRLAAGTRLPTHRALAYGLGLTVGTVSRAYAEAERRGLIAAHVGRGTFVAEPRSNITTTPGPAVARNDVVVAFDKHALDALPAPGEDEERLDLSLNYPHAGPVAAALASGLAALADPAVLDAIGRYQPPNGMLTHRRAAAHWLARGNMDADPDDIIIVPGCQGGLLATFMALAEPGETVLTESLTWPGLRATTAPLGVHTRAVAMDGDGLRPDAFDAACGQFRPRLLYVTPNLHNPTCAVMPEARRREIAAIADRHGVFVLEDDVYGFLLDDPPPPIRAFLPERGLYVTSVSKSVAPGLRVGYLWAPPALRSRLAGAVRANVMMTSPVAAELARQLIIGGGADEAAARQRAQARRRQMVAAERLEGLSYENHPAASHLWLKVPSPWRRGELAASLLDRGVAVTPGMAFAGDASVTVGADHVRLCLCAIAAEDRFARAIDIVGEIARAGPATGMPVV